MSKYKVFSMFDGVGGFIVGLNNANKDFFEITHSNQFEPSRKSQDAFEVGVYNFPNINHSNIDIIQVSNDYFDELKQQGVNMIVGGFPCQDYSVARSRRHELGIEGKKGVLFWEIIRAVNHINPECLILENVDRLLKSPSKQRGRDFAIMLGAFNQLGYSVEWRIINASEYGCSQRRRRVFFYVYRNDTVFAKAIDDEFSIEKTEFELADDTIYDEYILKKGLFARQFPVKEAQYKNRHYSDLLSKVESNSKDYIVDISDNFTGTIWNTGIMRFGKYYTIDTKPIEEQPKTLGEVVEEVRNYYIDKYGQNAYQDYIESYVISDKDKIEKFKYLRGSKKIERTTEDGYKWIYSEGGMSEVDELNLPSRTMLTSEGTVNRSTHFLKYGDRYRLITPIEAELLQDFPPDWTKYKIDETGKEMIVSDRMRMFFMGNALVTKIVERIGVELVHIVNEFDEKLAKAQIK